MRRITVLLSAMIVMCSFAACGGNGSDTTSVVSQTNSFDASESTAEDTIDSMAENTANGTTNDTFKSETPSVTGTTKPSESGDIVATESSDSSSRSSDSRLDSSSDATGDVESLDWAIDLVENGLQAIRTKNAAETINYTDVDAAYILSDTDEALSDDLTGSVQKSFDENSELWTMLSMEFTPSGAVKHTDFAEKITKYMQENYKEDVERTDFFEKHPITDVVLVKGSVSDGEHSDTGAYFVLNIGGEWKFDIYFSLMMEMTGEWQGIDF